MEINLIGGVFEYRHSVVTNDRYAINIMGREHIKAVWDKKKFVIRRLLISSKDPQQYVKRK